MAAAALRRRTAAAAAGALFGAASGGGWPHPAPYGTGVAHAARQKARKKKKDDDDEAAARRKQPSSLVQAALSGATGKAAAGAFATALLHGLLESVPEHMQSSSQRFSHYADCNRGQRMSIGAFFCSLLGLPRGAGVPNLADDCNQGNLPTLCEQFSDDPGAGEGGTIPYETFAVLSTLLRHSQSTIARAFFVHDAGERDALDSDEFAQMVCDLHYALCRPDSDSERATAWAANARATLPPSGRPANDLSLSTDQLPNALQGRFFGGGGLLDLDTLLSWYISLRSEVWIAQFRHYDTAGDGTLPPEAFAQMALRSAGVSGATLDREMAAFRKGVRRARDTRGRDGSSGYEIDEEGCDAAAWIAFNRLLQLRPQLKLSVALAGRPLLTPESWWRVCRAATYDEMGNSMTRCHTDLVFALFDRDGDGLLSPADVTGSLLLFAPSKMKRLSGSGVEG